MEMVPVNCNNIKSIGYNENNNLLQIKFNNNSTYEYHNVDLIVFAELLYSKSKSTFAQQYIYDKYTNNKVIED